MPRSFPIDPNSSSRAQRRRNSESSSRQTYETKALPKMVIRGAARTVSEGFDPNAFDGDGDLRVQDGTAFERPAMPRMPDVLAGATGAVTGDFKGMSPKQISERAVPSSPTQMLADIEAYSKAIGRDDFSIQSLRRILAEIGQVGAPLEFDFRPETVEKLRNFTRVALEDNPQLLEAVQSLGLPPMAVGLNMDDDVAGGMSELYPFMFFRPEEIEPKGRVGKAINKMRNFVGNAGMANTTQKYLGTDPKDLLAHEFGHWMLVSGLHKGITPEQRELSALYLQNNWEDWSNGQLQSAMTTQIAQRLAQQGKDIGSAVDNGDDVPTGAPFVNSYYGQMSPAEFFAEGVSAYFSKDKNTEEYINSTLASHIEKVFGKKPTGGMRSTRSNYAHIRRTQTNDIDAIVEASVPSSFDELMDIARSMPTYVDNLAPGWGDMEFDFSDKAVKTTRAYVRRTLEKNPEFADVVAKFGMPPIAMLKGRGYRFSGVFFPQDGCVIGIDETHIKGGLPKRAMLALADKLGLGELAGLVSAHQDDTLVHEYGHYLAEIVAAIHPNDSVRNAMSMMTSDTWFPLTIGSNIPGATEITALAKRMREFQKGGEPPSYTDDVPWVNSAYGLMNPSEFFAESFTARYSRHTKDYDINDKGRDLVAMATGMRSEKRTPVEKETPELPEVARREMPVYKEGSAKRELYTGPQANRIDWLSDYTNAEIAEIIVPQSLHDAAVIMGQHRMGNRWGQDPVADKSKILEAMGDLLKHGDRALDFSPEGRKEIVTEVRRALDTSPAFSWVVRRYGMPPILFVSKASYEKARDALPLDDNKKPDKSGLHPNLRGSRPLGWFELYGGAITINGSDRTWLKNFEPGSPEASRYHTFQDSDSPTGTIQYLGNVSMDRPSLIRHEWAHYLWDLFNYKGHQYRLRDLYGAGGYQRIRLEMLQHYAPYVGNIYGDNENIRSMIRMPDGRLVPNPQYFPQNLERRQERNDGPIVKSVYAHSDPAELFAEGFAAYSSEDPKLRELANDAMNAVFDRVFLIDGTVAQQVFSSRPWEIGRKQQQERIQRLIEEIATNLGINADDKTTGMRSMRGNTIVPPFTKEEIKSRLDSAENDAKRVIEGLLDNNGIWEKMTLDGQPYSDLIPSDVAKRAEESVKLRVTTDGMPVLRAEPHPILRLAFGEALDGHNEYEIPKRDVINDIVKTVEGNYAEVEFDPNNPLLQTLKVNGRNIARLQSDGGGNYKILQILEPRYRYLTDEEINFSMNDGYGSEEPYSKFTSWVENKILGIKSDISDETFVLENTNQETLVWAGSYIAGLKNPDRVLRSPGQVKNAEGRTHDALGHFGFGNGFDRHGEFGNSLAMLKLIELAVDEGALTKGEGRLVKRLWLGGFEGDRLFDGRFDESERRGTGSGADIALGTILALFGSSEVDADSQASRIYVGNWEIDVEQPLRKSAIEQGKGMRSERKPLNPRDKQFHEAIKLEKQDRAVTPIVGMRSVVGRYKGDVTWGPYSGSQEAEQQFGDTWFRPKLFPNLVTGKSKNVPNLTLHGIKDDDGSFRSVLGIYQSPKGKTFRIVAQKGLVKAFVDGTKTRAGAITFYDMGDGTEIHEALVGAKFKRQGLGTAMLEAASSLYSDTISFSNALSDEGRAWMEGTRNATTKAPTEMVNDIEERIAKGNLGMASKRVKKNIASQNDKFEKRFGYKPIWGDGDCYEAAYTNAMDRMGDFNASNIRVVHGVPLGTGGDAEGIRYGHAWIEGDMDLGGFTQPMVFDFSNGREIVLPKDFYYMVGSIIEDDTTRYTVEEAEELATRNGHYGPW